MLSSIMNSACVCVCVCLKETAMGFVFEKSNLKEIYSLSCQAPK